MNISLGLPTPKSISAQDLLQSSLYQHAGWLRKQGRRNILPGARKIFSWRQMYVIISEGCVYYYLNETSRVPSGSLSLYGYNQVFRASEIVSSECPWAFKICHAFPQFKTYFLSAASEVDMKEWMGHMKRAMLSANNMTVHRTQGDGGDTDSMNRSTTQSTTHDESSGSFDGIEDPIYQDTTSLTLYEDAPLPKREEEVSDDEDYIEPRGSPPPIPGKYEFASSSSHATLRKELANIIGKREGSKGSPFFGRHDGDGRMTKPHTKEDSQPLRPERHIIQVNPAKPDILVKPVTALKPVIPGKPPRLPSSQGTTSSQPTSPVCGKHPTLSEPPEPEDDYEFVDPVANSDDDDDTASYWAKIHWEGDTHGKAEEVIRHIGTEGVYLVRAGTTGGKVLVVLANMEIKKYQVKVVGDEYFILSGPHFKSLEDMLFYYYSNDLPTVSTRLHMPYKAHPKYSSAR